MITQAVAVLIRCDFGIGLRQSQIDYRATNQMVENNIVPSQNTGVYTIKYYAPHQIREIKNAQEEARAVVRRWTKPWDNDGWCLLYNIDFEKFTGAIQKSKEKLSVAVAKFQDELPDYMIANEERLGESYKEGFYPAVDEVANLVKIDVSYKDLTEDDRRVTSMEELAKVRDEVENAAKSKEENSTGSEGMTLEQYLAKQAILNAEIAARKAASRKKKRPEPLVQQAAFSFVDEQVDIIEPEHVIADEVAVVPVTASQDEISELDHLAYY
jgi:hypothetical protein